MARMGPTVKVLRDAARRSRATIADYLGTKARVRYPSQKTLRRIGTGTLVGSAAASSAGTAKRKRSAKRRGKKRGKAKQ